MKLKGEIAGTNEVPICIPRADKDVVFIAKAIPDTSLFEKMCPAPQPRSKKLPGGQEIPNFEDPSYKRSLDAWAEKKTAWYVIKSLTEGTPDLEWEKTSLEDHTTWMGFRKELTEFGLNDAEINFVVHGCLQANSLSEFSFEAARKRFLASRQEAVEKSSCLKEEQNSTPSTEPVSEPTGK